MAVYLASDMHLRLDRPDRAERLARWVGTLEAHDELYLVGDVCDFWFATRQVGQGAAACPGLAALAAFRQRGGSLIILLGNHDLWLGPFYEAALGARIVPEPFDLVVAGQRLHLEHGHRSGGRQSWKAAMETRAFYQAFAALPDLVARQLDRRLDRTNERGRTDDEDRLVAVFTQVAGRLGGAADIAVFGHVHRPVDQPTAGARLIVLGGWHHGSSYLRVDETGAWHVVNPGNPIPKQVGS